MTVVTSLFPQEVEFSKTQLFHSESDFTRLPAEKLLRPQRSKVTRLTSTVTRKDGGTLPDRVYLLIAVATVTTSTSLLSVTPF